MNYKDTMKKLEKLYGIAVKNCDSDSGLRIVEAMIRSGAAEATK